jgi:hypothetical protein
LNRPGLPDDSLVGDGAAKTQYWLDPETGIAVSRFRDQTLTAILMYSIVQGICFTNVFATNPCPFTEFYNESETALYKALEDSK